jgi:hypothetical protein
MDKDNWDELAKGASRPPISSDSAGTQLDRHLHGHNRGNEKEFADSGRPGSRRSVPHGTRVR